MDNQNKNTFLAIVLSSLILVAWWYFYAAPKIEDERRQAEVETVRQAQQQSGEAGSDKGDVASGNNIPQAGTNAATGADQIPGLSGQSRDEVLALDDRIVIENGNVIGSINLKGARIDDLRLKNYHETIDNSALITLLSPAQMANGYFAEFGFSGNGKGGELPGPTSQWQFEQGSKLGPASPVILTWQNDQGLVFTRKFEIDDNFMISVTEAISNTSSSPVSLSSYGRLTRFGTPETANIFVLHEGMIGVFGDEGLQEIDYGDIIEEREKKGTSVSSGWLGITDKYWATALVPANGDTQGNFTPRFSHFSDGRAHFQADFLSSPLDIAAGNQVSLTHRLFAGAKISSLIDGYEEDLKIDNFNLMIDWGWFHFITRPLFKFMDWLYHLVGNFGVAILITTVAIKLLMFPLANMSYASMAKMKKVQPEMERLKAAAGSDRAKLQQDMMALYRREKINPAAGCWPLLIQIPVFFALYKVIYVTIEMRHAPFFGWIQDLSAADPTSIFNLFGLISWNPSWLPVFGIWPLLMGITMFVQMQMNPAPPDPTQAMIFKWMPIVFTIMLASFPAGLVIYWAWNNFLSILQQGYIMKKHGTEIALWDNLKSLFKGKSETKNKSVPPETAPKAIQKQTSASDRKAKPETKAERSENAAPIDADKIGAGKHKRAQNKPGKRKSKKRRSGRRR